MQAVTALAHLKSAVLYIMDISEQCDHSLDEQIQLFESIRPQFSNKPVYVGLNKVDILRRGDLPPEKAEFLTKLDQQNIPIVDMSTVSQEGIMNLRDQVC